MMISTNLSRSCRMSRAVNEVVLDRLFRNTCNTCKYVYIHLWFYLMTIVTTSNWKIFILVSIRKSCIIYFEKNMPCRQVMEIHFLVMEKSWKIIVEKQWSPWNDKVMRQFSGKQSECCRVVRLQVTFVMCNTLQNISNVLRTVRKRAHHCYCQ